MILPILLLVATGINAADEAPYARAMRAVAAEKPEKVFEPYAQLKTKQEQEEVLQAFFQKWKSTWNLTTEDKGRLLQITWAFVNQNPQSKFEENLTSVWKKDLARNYPPFAERYNMYVEPKAASAAAAASSSSSSSSASATKEKESAAQEPTVFKFIGRQGGIQTIPMEAARNPVLSGYLARYNKDSIKPKASRNVVSLIVRALELGHTAYKRASTEPTEKRNAAIVNYIVEKMQAFKKSSYLDGAIKQAQELEAPLLVEAFKKLQDQAAKERTEESAFTKREQERAASFPLPYQSSAASSSSSAPPTDFYLVSSENHIFSVPYSIAQDPAASATLAKRTLAGEKNFRLKGSDVLIQMLATALRWASDQQFAHQALTPNQKNIHKAQYMALYAFTNPQLVLTSVAPLLHDAQALGAPLLIEAILIKFVEGVVLLPSVDVAWIKKVIPADLLPIFARLYFIATGNEIEPALGIPTQKIDLDRLVMSGRLQRDLLFAYRNVVKHPNEKINGYTLAEAIVVQYWPLTQKIAALQALLKLQTEVPIDEADIRAKIALLSGAGPSASSSSSAGSAAAGSAPSAPTITPEVQAAFDDLGLPTTATSEEVKKTFRKLALVHHPDKGGNPETFKTLNNAYEVLRKHLDIK